MSKKNHIGKRVKAFRMEHLLTQPQAAAILGVSLPTICRLEAGANCYDVTRARIEKAMAAHSSSQAAA